MGDPIDIRRAKGAPNRAQRRAATAGGILVGEADKVTKLEHRLCYQAQLIHALLLERVDPSQPAVFRRSEVLALDPQGWNHEADPATDLIAIKLATVDITPRLLNDTGNHDE